MKGIYVLVVSVSRNVSASVGALGTVRFEKGLYCYAGSAQNNLEKRIKRHLEKNKREFWHIDYLLANDVAEVVRVFYQEAGKSEECAISKKLAERGVPVKGFGSSDCECNGHLVKIENYAFLRESMFEIAVRSAQERIQMQSGWCVWITGLPGSGKSVVSQALLALLNERNVPAQLLSSDALRKILTPKPSYSREERDMVYTTLVYIAELLTQNGVNVVIDATGNLRCYRKNARTHIQKFFEAYLRCPLEVCIQREAKRDKTYCAPKQIYARARKGKAPTVPGVGQPYEPPLKPEVAIDTTKHTPEESARRILETMLKLDGRL